MGLGSTLDAALLKIEAALAPHWQGDIDRVKRAIHLDPTGWLWNSEPVPLLPLLHEALWLGQKVEIDYRRNDGQFRQRVVDPYGFVAKSAVWYLVGAVEGQVRIFRASRVYAARLLEEASERPREFDVRAYWETWNRSFAADYTAYAAHFRLAPEGMQRLYEAVDETVRHSIQEESPPDSQGWRTLALTFSSLLHARTVALGIGNFLEVLEPAELREAVYTQARQIAALYEENGSAPQ